MDRYIGLDAHSSSCTVAVVGPSGRRLQSQVLETNGRVLINFIRTIPQSRHLCFEEGVLANWLHEILEPYVRELVVTRVQQSRGPKSDKIDAFGLAESLRVGAIKQRVYKGKKDFGQLSELCQAYTSLVKDVVRVQLRIKSLYRAWAIPVSGQRVYSSTNRDEWLARLPSRVRSRAGYLFQEYEALKELRQQARKEMLVEARRHAIWGILKTCPGMGMIRISQLIPIVVTPYRFSNKRAFWAYSGLAVVVRSSSDWVRARDGSWVKADVNKTRGLNRNFNRTLKEIFKGAATTVIRNAKDEPLYRHYVNLLDGGTKPNLAKLTIARQIASIILSMWRGEEAYDPEKIMMPK